MAGNWTREQLIIAFNLYCKIPFAKAVKSNPQVIRVAQLVGRTPSAVAFKLGNFGSFDPELRSRGIGGLPNASKLDRKIWDEFHDNWEQLAYLSEQLIGKMSTAAASADGVAFSEFPEGLDRQSTVKVRVNQAFFRQAILGLYEGRCCITGLAVPDLLVASHIVPWSVDAKNRTNPRNGLCLNVLHDRAFDRGLLTITADYKVKIASSLRETQTPLVPEFLTQSHNVAIRVPDKFLPDAEYLRFHNQNIFIDA